MASSDDEIDYTDILATATQRRRSGSNESDLPGWLTSQSPAVPSQAPIVLTSSDDDDPPQPPAKKAKLSEELDKAHRAAPAGSQPEGEPGSSTQATGSQPAGSQPAGSQPKPAAKSARPDVLANRSEVMVVFPEKLQRNKVVVELEPAGHAATDLSGDAGAVGRLLVAGPKGKEQLRIDLKGVQYKASVLPLAGTMCVINLGGADAKVECLVNDFVRLQEEGNMMDDDAQLGAMLGANLHSDDEGGGDDAGGEAGPSKAAGKKGKDAGKKEGAKKPRAKPLGAGSKPKDAPKKPRAGAASKPKAAAAGKSKAAGAGTSGAGKGGAAAGGSKAAKSAAGSKGVGAGKKDAFALLLKGSGAAAAAKKAAPKKRKLDEDSGSD